MNGYKNEKRNAQQPSPVVRNGIKKISRIMTKLKYLITTLYKLSYLTANVIEWGQISTKLTIKFIVRNLYHSSSTKNYWY